jgi:predicted nucleotide-binding protein
MNKHEEAIINSLSKDAPTKVEVFFDRLHKQGIHLANEEGAPNEEFESALLSLITKGAIYGVGHSSHLEDLGITFCVDGEISVVAGKYIFLNPSAVQRVKIPRKSKGRSMPEDEEQEFKVFVSHGRNSLWHEVSRFIEKQLEIETVELEEQLNQGKTIIEKLEDAVSECSFAIVVMTAEDEQKSGQYRTRQNVIHEIGYLQGSLGRENVLVLKESGVEEFSNISGIVYESFYDHSIRSTFERIRREIEHAVDNWEADIGDE